MRKWLGAFIALTMAVGGVLALGRPGPATAQGGGTIEVEVKYNGAPVVDKIKVNKDTQKCGTEAVIEKVAVGANKGLANAVVSVPGAKGPAKALKATIDQHGCKFVPHVVAMTPGEIEIKNSDDILHNLHTYSTANPSINKAQPKFKKVMTEKFEKPEFVKVTCDVHSWMLGWIAVLPTSFFGVTDAGGAAKIENVPAGKHKVEVWHETLGKQDKDVEVKAGQTAKVTFEMVKK
jgi:plastocyanin